MDPIPAKDALTTLLATEALLIAASTLAATIGSNPRPNTPATRTPVQAAKAIASVMTVVSLGALAAWIDLYACGDGFDNVASVFEGGALFVALIAIPGIGWLCAYWAEP